MHQKLGLLGLTASMLISGSVVHAQAATGFVAPGTDARTRDAWTFQKMVGAVFARAHADLVPNTASRAVGQSRYDASNNHQGRNCVGAVKPQGDCGSCWDFAATAVLEAAYCQEFDTEVPDLSEQRTLECFTEVDPGGRCAGGWELFAYDVMRTHGVPRETDSPYDFNNLAECQGGRSGEVLFGIDGSRFYQAGEETGQPSVDEIKQAIVETGAVTVALSVTSAFDGHDGVTPITTTRENLTMIRGLHEVVATGWDDELGAWRIKNSWGNSWADGGLGWLSYNDLSILGSHFSTVTPRREWTHNEQAQIMNAIVGEMLTYRPALLSSAAEVSWPASLGFPEEKMTVDEGLVVAARLGIYQSGTSMP